MNEVIVKPVQWTTKTYILLVLNVLWRLVPWVGIIWLLLAIVTPLSIWKPLLLVAIIPAMLLTMKDQIIPPLQTDERYIPRYRLAKIFRWAETPDELLPGGMYEPTVAKIYNFIERVTGKERIAVFFTSWYWMIRNSAHGMLWNQGTTIPLHQHKLGPELQEKYGIWEKRYPLGPVTFVIGTKSVDDKFNISTKTGYWCYPRITARLSKNMDFPELPR